MKRLREGISTGSCAAAAACAAAYWELYGEEMTSVEVETPIGRTLRILVNAGAVRGDFYVIKDAGDDPDVTHGCEVHAQVVLTEAEGAVTFEAGEGVGMITEAGLKLPPGEPAINPVPRKMITDTLRKVIGRRGCHVIVSIPGGEELAIRTMNGKLGIRGGLSILGTTGIVRPMSEEAMKDTLALELQMRVVQGHQAAALVMGNTGEQALHQLYGTFSCVIQVSNYIGYMVDEAEMRGMEYLLIGGFAGKLVKLAANIMNTHSHVADGRNEVLCTHAALKGADMAVIRQLYECRTIREADQILKTNHLLAIYQEIAEKAQQNLLERAHGKITIGVVLLDTEGKELAKSSLADCVLEVLGGSG